MWPQRAPVDTFLLPICFLKRGNHMTKFTETSVAKIAPPPGSTDYIAWDDETPGFGIRFQNGAERGTFIVQYRIGTKQRRQSVGRVGKVTLEAAREAAKTYNAK